MSDSSTMELQGRRGPGAFQWNRGGWFGAQCGATLWLVLLGGLLLAQSRSVGAAVLLCGLVPNAVGIWLWRRRDAWTPYPAVQVLLVACGLCALLALLCVRAEGGELPGAQPLSLWTLSVYPGLMLAFHLQERGARRTSV